MTEVLFSRTGRSFSAYRVDEKGQPFTTEVCACSRCGGLGGSDRWKHTGYTCFECGGSGRGRTITIKLYTAEQNAKLDASAAKRAAKAAAKTEAKHAEAVATANAIRADFLAVHGALLDSARPYAEGNDFITDIIDKADRWASLSEGQANALRAAVDRAKAREAANAASGWVGSVGERVEASMTVVSVSLFERPSFNGFSKETCAIVTMLDDAGNCFVTKGSFYAEKGDKFRLRATIKEHSEFKGRKQTVLQRAKIIEAAEAA